MKIRPLILVVVGVVLHSTIMIISFGAMFGMGYMHPSDIDPIYKFFWQSLFVITSFPLLWLRLNAISSAFALHPFIIAPINSLIAFTIAYMACRFIRSMRRARR